MIFCFYFPKDCLSDFDNWLASSLERKGNETIGVVFKDILKDYWLRDENKVLCVLSLEFVLPNVLPGFFFKSVIKKSLLKAGVYNVRFVKYSVALKDIILSGVDCEPGVYF